MRHIDPMLIIQAGFSTDIAVAKLSLPASKGWVALSSFVLSFVVHPASVTSDKVSSSSYCHMMIIISAYSTKNQICAIFLKRKKTDGLRISNMTLTDPCGTGGPCGPGGPYGPGGPCDNNMGNNDIKYYILACHSCCMMIIQHANLLHLVHILIHYTFWSQFRTVVHCLVYCGPFFWDL